MRGHTICIKNRLPSSDNGPLPDEEILNEQKQRSQRHVSRWGDQGSYRRRGGVWVMDRVTWACTTVPTRRARTPQRTARRRRRKSRALRNDVPMLGAGRGLLYGASLFAVIDEGASLGVGLESNQVPLGSPLARASRTSCSRSSHRYRARRSRDDATNWLIRADSRTALASVEESTEFLRSHGV